MDYLVSVVITTKNSDKTLRKLLKSIKDQTYSNYEIILVDNNSNDDTIKIAKEYTKLVFNFGPERSAQRNFAASKAKGEYILVLDSDMVLTKNVIKECVEGILSNNNIGGIIIPEKSFGNGFWSKAKVLEREINEGESYFEAARFFSKNIFWEFRGFDEDLTGPEDWDLSRRIGKKYKIFRIDNCILHNEGMHTLKGLMLKKYYYGLSAYKYLQKENTIAINAQTIYFLRPAFYKKWKLLLRNPLLSVGMIIMLTSELLGGGIGYIIGRIRND